MNFHPFKWVKTSKARARVSQLLSFARPAGLKTSPPLESGLFDVCIKLTGIINQLHQNYTSAGANVNPDLTWSLKYSLIMPGIYNFGNESNKQVSRKQDCRKPVAFRQPVCKKEVAPSRKLSLRF